MSCNIMFLSASGLFKWICDKNLEFYTTFPFAFSLFDKCILQEVCFLYVQSIQYIKYSIYPTHPINIQHIVFFQHQAKQVLCQSNLEAEYVGPAALFRMLTCIYIYIYIYTCVLSVFISRLFWVYLFFFVSSDLMLQVWVSNLYLSAIFSSCLAPSH